MEFTQNIYTDNAALITRATQRVAEKHNLLPEELLGDAFEILIITVQKFNEAKGTKFSTWLTWQLQHLHTCALRIKGIAQQKEDYVGCIELFEEAVGNIDLNYNRMELLDSIATELSTNSQLYLKDLLNGHYTKVKSIKGGRPNKFPIPVICTKYNWNRSQALSVREEITTWWNQYNVA